MKSEAENTPATAASSDSVAERILATALEIINETGDFDLPMRLLASRAKVSLRTPYTIFGSKSGVISALLLRDQHDWREQILPLQTNDPISDLFANLARGMDFYRVHQPFYRALFRATQSYSGFDESEPARQNLRPMAIACSRAKDHGQLDANVDVDVLAETLTDIIASVMREWAASSFDIALAGYRGAFGYGAILSGVTIEPHRSAVRQRMLDAQEAIAAFRDETGSPWPSGSSRRPRLRRRSTAL